MAASHTESALTSSQNPGTNEHSLFSASVNILLTNISVPVILDVFSKLKISSYYSHLKDGKTGTINMLSSPAKKENMLQHCHTSDKRIFISQSGVILLLSLWKTSKKWAVNPLVRALPAPQLPIATIIAFLGNLRRLLEELLLFMSWQPKAAVSIKHSIPKALGAGWVCGECCRRHSEGVISL